MNDNFFTEMPLSLKIEQYQRDKMITGMMSPAESTQQKEMIKILQSLKYVQQFEENVDEVTQMLRQRSYQSFLRDKTGSKLR